MHTYIYMYIFDVLSLLFFGTYFFMCLLIEEHKTHSPFSLSISRFFNFSLLLTTMQIMFNCREAIMDSRSFMKILTLPSTHIPTHTHTNTHSVWASDAYHYIHCYVITNWALVTLTDHTTKCNTLRRIAPSVCDLLSSSFDYSFLRNIWHLCPFAQQQMYSCTLVSERKKK